MLGTPHAETGILLEYSQVQMMVRQWSELSFSTHLFKHLVRARKLSMFPQLSGSNPQKVSKYVPNLNETQAFRYEVSFRFFVLYAVYLNLAIS